MSRRELFALFRRPVAEPDANGSGPTTEPSAAASAPAEDTAVETAAPAFSLETFYAARSPDRVLPPFAIRAQAATPTTRVGIGRTDAANAPATDPAPATPIPADQVPVVLGHRCLATTTFCSVCVERCPRHGAIVVERGRPRVVAASCDGCGQCIAACPAPILAFALAPRTSGGGR